MELKTIISILENCHTQLYFFCDDDENKNTPWYVEARKRLRHTIRFMKTQQCDRSETLSHYYNTATEVHIDDTQIAARCISDG